jgi:hypothetical protein
MEMHPHKWKTFTEIVTGWKIKKKSTKRFRYKVALRQALIAQIVELTVNSDTKVNGQLEKGHKICGGSTNIG